MLARVREWFRSRYAPVLPPPHDPWAGWERIVAAAADAWPVELRDRLTDAEVQAIAEGRNDRCDALREAMREGGELWRFSSPREAWQARCGRAGIALVRDGVPVCSVVTMLN